MPTTGKSWEDYQARILSLWSDSSMLFRLEHHALPFSYTNHAAWIDLRSFCLNLRRTNKFFRKCVDSFSTLPIMRLHTAGVISSAGRAPPLQGGGRRFDPVITHHFGSLAQLVEQLTFNQLVAGSNPARPTNVKRRPKGAFLLSAICKIRTCRRFGVERSETTEPVTATARRASEASHPARPTNAKRALAAPFCYLRFIHLPDAYAYQAYRRYRTRRPDKTLVAIRHRRHTVNAATSFSSAGVACCWSYTIYKSAGIRSSNGRNTTPGQFIWA